MADSELLTAFVEGIRDLAHQDMGPGSAPPPRNVFVYKTRLPEGINPEDIAAALPGWRMVRHEPKMESYHDPDVLANVPAAILDAFEFIPPQD